jgi:hypothetical protein
MSRKADEGLAEIKRPPQRALPSNMYEEWMSQKDEEAVAMEEGVPFEEKEKTKGDNPQKFVAKEGIGLEYKDASGSNCMVSPSRRQDVSPGAEELGSQQHHPIEGRHNRNPERVRPGAFREGGLDNEEGYDEDELTIESRSEPIPSTLECMVPSHTEPIPPSAVPVNTEEEERHFQDKVNEALQMERQLVQDQINQALQREREQAVVAEAVPEDVLKRHRRWKLVGLLLLLVLIVVGVVLGITLRPEPETLEQLLSSASSDSGVALSTPSSPQNKALKWLANNINLATYSAQEKIQRYALATLYYSTRGESWNRSDFWLSDEDVCGKWYQINKEWNDTTIDCTSSGAVSNLSLFENNLSGSIPPEIGMLSDSLGEFILEGRMHM